MGWGSAAAVHEVAEAHAAGAAVLGEGAWRVTGRVLHLGLGPALLGDLIALDELLGGGAQGIDLLLGHAFVEIPVGEGLALPEFVEVRANPVEHAGDLGVVGEQHHALAMRDAALLDVADLERGGNPVGERQGLTHRGEGAVRLGLVIHDAAVEHGGGEEAALHGRAGGEDAAVVEEGLDHLLDAEFLEFAAVRRGERREGAHEEVQAGLRDEVREQLAEADLDGEEAAETHRGGESGERLGDEEVQIINGGAFDVPLAMREFKEGLVVENEAGVGAAAERVKGENSVVRLRDHAGDLRRRQHCAGEHGNLRMFFLQGFDEQRAEARTGTTARGVKHDDATDVVALVDFDVETPHDLREDLTTGAEITDGKVAARAFSAGNEVRGIEERAGGRLDVLNDAGLEVHHHGARDEAAATALAETREERAPVPPRLLSLGGLAGERVDAVLLADGFPKRGRDLVACLAD